VVVALEEAAEQAAAVVGLEAPQALAAVAPTATALVPWDRVMLVVTLAPATATLGAVQ